MARFLFSGLLIALAASAASAELFGDDYLRQLQNEAIRLDRSEAAHWGADPAKYTQWGSHSNRLIPVYTFGTRGAGQGVDLEGYMGRSSVYRQSEQVARLYGRIPAKTIDPQAEYMDQTNLHDLQMAAAAAGKRHIFLVVFDGMDWQTTRAASVYNSRKVAYDSGRGTGTYFQKYMAGGTSQFGYMVTSPHNDGTEVDVDQQQVRNPGGDLPGGYDADRGGRYPWEAPSDRQYLISRPKSAADRHAYTDSSSSAVSMTAGIKTYNNAVNVDPFGRPVLTIAHKLQQQDWLVGVVTSVPISHATPAAAYSHNVSRNDYQDLTRDLLGRPSISHPTPLPGMDIVIGCGWGVTAEKSPGQGENFVPGNVYLPEADLAAVDARQGGRYVVAQRSLGVDGGEGLMQGAEQAAREGKRLLGFYGAAQGNLPFQTADGDFQPATGRKGKAIKYTAADLKENPTLAEMTAAALLVAGKSERFWLLVEPGDVDWANHDNNLDASIGAVNSGDAAFRTIVEWVEQNSNWEQALVIVTADHGHYLTLDRPEMLIPPEAEGQ